MGEGEKETDLDLIGFSFKIWSCLRAISVTRTVQATREKKKKISGDN